MIIYSLILIPYGQGGRKKELHVQLDEGPCPLHSRENSSLDERKEYKFYINDSITRYRSYTVVNYSM